MSGIRVRGLQGSSRDAVADCFFVMGTAGSGHFRPKAFTGIFCGCRSGQIVDFQCPGVAVSMSVSGHEPLNEIVYSSPLRATVICPLSMVHSCLLANSTLVSLLLRMPSPVATTS